MVPRLRLNESLRRALLVPLTLVSAPPGFGKTTAAVTAVRALQAGDDELALAWLSLDAHDNEPLRFWRYVFAALDIAAPGLGAPGFNALVQSQPLPVRALLPDLLNAVANRPQEHLLVLDDYFFIEQPEIHDDLTFILENAPPNLHVLLATRADPPLPLHRLRARGLLAEIRAADLRFDRAEIAAFLNEIMALALNEDEIASLARQTDGWAAGLQLAGLALQGAVADGQARHALIDRLAHNNRFILEYLTEEVLAQQPLDAQHFLLQTAVLDHLCAPLCDAVTQGERSRELLESLVQRNLFVMATGSPLPGDGDDLRWYRYHPLFADLLRGQIQQQQPDLLPVLHQRAAEWYEERGALDTAIEHALKAADHERVAHLLEDHAGRVIMQGRIQTVGRWLQRLPEDRWRALPRTNLAFAWALLMRGRYSDIEPYLLRAEAGIPEDDRELRAEFHALSAALADTQADATSALVHARAALNQVAADNLRIQAMAYTALGGALRTMGDVDGAIAAYERGIPLCQAAKMPLPELLSRAHLSFLYMLQGRLRQAEATARPALEPIVRHPVAGAAHAALGEILLEWNRIDEAAEHIEQSVALAEKTDHNAALVRGLTGLARLCRAQGNQTGALAALDRAAALILHGVPRWVKPLLVAERVNLLLDQGALAAAESLCDTHISDSNAGGGHVSEALPLAQARVLCHRREWTQAQTLLDSVLAEARTGGRQGRVIEAMLLRAVVRDAQGAASAARRDVQQALELAADEGYVRVFVDAGPQLARLLAQIDDEYARHLLAAFPDAGQTSAVESVDLPEPLTDRELDVLRLMAQGLTYQAIADSLVLSINTVRYHVKGIYSKLHVETRTAAIEQARTLSIYP
ncbi:MAG: LuxR C-terminal-related transcriptional regulator [Phototrophicaceae bacterium]